LAGPPAEAARQVCVWGTKVTEAGVEQLKKSLPNVVVNRQRAGKCAKLQNV